MSRQFLFVCYAMTFLVDSYRTLTRLKYPMLHRIEGVPVLLRRAINVRRFTYFASCTLALARRFSTTLRCNLQAPVRRSSARRRSERRIRPLLPFFFYLFLSRARDLVGADSDNPRHRSLSFRVYRSCLRLPMMNRHPYFA